MPAVGDDVVAVAGGTGRGQEFVLGQPAGQVQAKLGSLKDPARLQLQRKYVEVGGTATWMDMDLDCSAYFYL